MRNDVLNLLHGQGWENIPGVLHRYDAAVPRALRLPGALPVNFDIALPRG